MNCFDCSVQDHRTTDAVALCSVCGAATCAPHTVAGYAEVEVRGVGNPSLRREPGRRLFCTTCAPARATATKTSGRVPVSVG